MWLIWEPTTLNYREGDRPQRPLHFLKQEGNQHDKTQKLSRLCGEAVSGPHGPHPALRDRPGSRRPGSPSCLSRGVVPPEGAALPPAGSPPASAHPRVCWAAPTHPSPHSSPQQVSMSSADTSTLTRPLLRMQSRSEMASTAPNACKNQNRHTEPHPALQALQPPPGGRRQAPHAFLVAGPSPLQRRGLVLKLGIKARDQSTPNLYLGIQFAAETCGLWFLT